MAAARRHVRASSRRRSIFLGVWIVYPAVNTVIRSFYDRNGHQVRLVRQLPGALHDPRRSRRRSRTTRSGSRVVPALVTAIGLVFAVLTERVRWSLAFKTAVFMPMAISLFAAGVIWRLMDQKDPEQRRAQRRDRRSSTTRSTRRACSPTRSPSTPTLTRHAPSRALVLEDAAPARADVALLGLTGIPPDAGARRARSRRSQPQPRAGRDRRRRLARLQAGRRHAGQGREGRARPTRREGRAAATRRARQPATTTAADDGTLRLRRPRARAATSVGDRLVDLRASRSAASPGSARS